MEKDYQTKDLKAIKSKPKPDKPDVEIYMVGDLYKFNWKDRIWSFGNKQDAEAGLKKISGQAESKD